MLLHSITFQPNFINSSLKNNILKNNNLRDIFLGVFITKF
jgi:hypothetical protein